ncbi:hypothetical protein LINGRAHAP2_LOCUS9405 [Linum grandiflorum]
MHVPNHQHSVCTSLIIISLVLANRWPTKT